MTKAARAMLATALFVLMAMGAEAQGQRGQGGRPPEGAQSAQGAGQAAARPAAMPEEKTSRTQGMVRIGGQEVRYTATAGTILLKEEDGRPKASIFYVAYTRDGAGEAAKRPVTYTFNGGPGSSSVWLHMGAFGPYRVKMDDEGMALPPPYELVANEGSILDATDLVFIDPVTTGYSRAMPGESLQQFHGYTQDIEAVGEFIRLWTVKNERWASPKFLAGESYGTTRAAGLAGFLQQRHGMYFNGVILVSSILNFQTARFDVGNDLPPALFLPTYTATAWYHKRLPGAMQQKGLAAAVEEARRFALGEYSTALMQGDRLSDAKKKEIAKRLAELTGLDEEFISRANLRMEIQRFVKELLRDQRRTVGRLDSRFVGMDRDAAGERNEFDPSMEAIRGPYATLVNDYARRVLGFDSDLPYEILTGRVQPWSYANAQNQYLNVAETLRGAMTRNPALKVLVANGYYDLATPFFATEYTFDHMQLDASVRGNVTMTYYEAGHMMYIRKKDLVQLREDVVKMIRGAARAN